jgi:predicted transcriptional regulator
VEGAVEGGCLVTDDVIELLRVMTRRLQEINEKLAKYALVVEQLSGELEAFATVLRRLNDGR